MDLTTRCPRCGTEFQAGLADLQLRKGYIRCVQCAHIFDGYAEVVSSSSQPSRSLETPQQSSQVSADRPSMVVPPLTVAPPVESALAPDSAPDDILTQSLVRPDPDGPQVFRAGRRGAVLADPPADPLHWRVEPQFDPDHHRPEPFVVEARPGHRTQGGSAAPLLASARGLSWWDRLISLFSGLALLILLLLALAQLAYVYRANLAQAVPALRPWLVQACVPLRCQVPYARDLGQIIITGSALKLQDALSDVPPDAAEAPAGAAASAAPADPPVDADQHYVLQATLRNQADHPQEWPSLILDLKDAAGTLLVRRNLSAIDYLGADSASQPFSAHSDVLIRLPFTLHGLKINGYQLDLFYP